MKKICIVLGTRPEIIKMMPIIRECKRVALPFFIVHTNQHYADSLDAIFFRELKLPKPKYHLGVGSGTHAETTAAALLRLEPVLLKEKPSCVLVEGDTNTVLAGALAAVKCGIPVGHVEAGLRSYDRTMPEEANRVLVDHCAYLLFAPTPRDANILMKEGIERKKVFLTGNTIVDALRESVHIAKRNSAILSHLKISKRRFVLATAHRQENVDSKIRISGIFKGLELIAREFEIPVIYTLHHSTRARLKKFKLFIPAGVSVIEPVGFFDFLMLEASAALCVTDSGGVQEESCILGTPCITVRENTERPDTVKIGSNMLAGTAPEKILSCARTMMSKKKSWKHPFGDGHAARRIVRILTNRMVH